MRSFSAPARALLAVLSVLGASALLGVRAARSQDAGARAPVGTMEFIHHCSSCHGEYRRAGCVSRVAPALNRERPVPFTEEAVRTAVRRGVRHARWACPMAPLPPSRVSEADLAAILQHLRARGSVR